MMPTTLKGLASTLWLAVIISACGDADRAADRALVSYTFFEEPGFSPGLLVVEFSDGGRARRLTGTDFHDGTTGRWRTREFETRTTGELVTSFWLARGSDTLSSGELRIDLRPDWRWNISFFREDEDPTLTCFGCVGSAPYPLRGELQTAPADSLWLVWGGNFISDPVIF